MNRTKPPPLLTFLAPAAQCNQRCPACLLEAMGEPVTQFDLTPEDYARFLSEFIDAGVPILSVAFQGYEVTLPRSWPYVEAVFAVAQRHRVRRGFVTNGMLLHKWKERLVALDPDHVTISLDGSTPAENDRLRGLPGALMATICSIERVLAHAPEFSHRLAVASCVYDDANYRSLLEMPKLLKQLGITRWAVSWELRREGDRAQSVGQPEVVFDWLAGLKRVAESEGIAFHTSDDFGMLMPEHRDALNARSVYDLRFMYRMDPLGYVRSGDELLHTAWDSRSARRWRPGVDDAVDLVGYRRTAESLRATG